MPKGIYTTEKKRGRPVGTKNKPKANPFPEAQPEVAHVGNPE